ncbi:hypothetical protein ATANTOWER_031884 [Ataeniobius toweri]|uniref:Uncharacterized protein n=1 Tax=Ataeniobius toweri TaxID=208326 RepID=A0ABU7AUD0_9TELE|nr:hypothetical protein [Ataeniobius toweri]
MNFVNESFFSHFVFEIIQKRKVAVIDDDLNISMHTSLKCCYVCHLNPLCPNPEGQHMTKKMLQFYLIQTRSTVIVVFCHLVDELKVYSTTSDEVSNTEETTYTI